MSTALYLADLVTQVVSFVATLALTYVGAALLVGYAELDLS